MSQPELAAMLSVDPSVVSRIENGKSDVDERMVQLLDGAFPDKDGWFSRFKEESGNWGEQFRSWFEDWVVKGEQRAAYIRWFEPLLIPGLLQTEGYIRALFRAWSAITPVTTSMETDVEARLARQAIFERDSPPSFHAVIDESVLRRCIGSPRVMHEQLMHVVEMSERPGLTVEVVPEDAGAYVGLLGGFAVATFADNSPGIVYTESPDEGATKKHPRTVAKMALTFDRVRDVALRVGPSRDLIRRVAEERWTA
ncbi:MAG: helix-turn-helix transcriptional regulator [Nocardiopsaceae bacterium]|nr:helix-turn-helix transcriptional regulator [Nocardiopsaceae bacterium]